MATPELNLTPVPSPAQNPLAGLGPALVQYPQYQEQTAENQARMYQAMGPRLQLLAQMGEANPAYLGDNAYKSNISQAFQAMGMPPPIRNGVVDMAGLRSFSPFFNWLQTGNNMQFLFQLPAGGGPTGSRGSTIAALGADPSLFTQLINAPRWEPPKDALSIDRQYTELMKEVTNPNTVLTPSAMIDQYNLLYQQAQQFPGMFPGLATPSEFINDIKSLMAQKLAAQGLKQDQIQTRIAGINENMLYTKDRDTLTKMDAAFLPQLRQSQINLNNQRVSELQDIMRLHDTQVTKIQSDLGLFTQGMSPQQIAMASAKIDKELAPLATALAKVTQNIATDQIMAANPPPGVDMQSILASDQQLQQQLTTAITDIQQQKQYAMQYAMQPGAQPNANKNTPAPTAQDKWRKDGKGNYQYSPDGTNWYDYHK